MQIRTQEHRTEDRTVVIYYQIRLSANETYQWATRPGNSWPCSQLKNHRIMACVDSNGLCDFTVDGKYSDDVDGTELAACIGDHLPDDCKRLWPCWD